MKIAIVNDAVMAIEALRRVLLLVPSYELLWVARDGAEAVRCCARQKPDLILMDLIMPALDGVEATRRIMAQSPCAILIVTASVDANSSLTFEALGAGALDAVSTPLLGATGQGEGATALLAKIATIGKLVRSDSPPGRDTPHPARVARKDERISPDSLVVIGASAGGPSALATILGELPADFPAAIVIIQHIDAHFARQLARWLDDQSPLPVRTTSGGECPLAGTVLIAETDDHMVLVDSCALGYTSEPAALSYRPSVDVFFESVVQHWKGEVVGVLLTGMGRDGARGLKALRQAGALTLAQDCETSVVYGMPKAAAEMGAAAEILPLESIAARLTALCARDAAGKGRAHG